MFHPTLHPKTNLFVPFSLLPGTLFFFANNSSKENPKENFFFTIFLDLFTHANLTKNFFKREKKKNRTTSNHSWKRLDDENKYCNKIESKVFFRQIIFNVLQFSQEKQQTKLKQNFVLRCIINCAREANSFKNDCIFVHRWKKNARKIKNSWITQMQIPNEVQFFLGSVHEILDACVNYAKMGGVWKWRHEISRDLSNNNVFLLVFKSLM